MPQQLPYILKFHGHMGFDNLGRKIRCVDPIVWRIHEVSANRAPSIADSFSLPLSFFHVFGLEIPTTSIFHLHHPQTPCNSHAHFQHRPAYLAARSLGTLRNARRLPKAHRISLSEPSPLIKSSHRWRGFRMFGSSTYYYFLPTPHQRFSCYFCAVNCVPHYPSP